MKKYALNKIDTHTHTYFSFDASENHNSPERMCEKACEKGLDAIIFTDHVEINSEVEHNFPPLDRAACRKQCEEARKLYNGRLDVYIGAEFGQITHYPEYAKEAAAEGNFDYIIGSVHNTKGEQDPYYMDFSKVTYKEILYMLDKYFDEYLQMTYAPFVDQCAHLTYPVRYIKAAGIDIDITRWDEKITEIMKSIISHGKTYELNSVYVRKKTELPEEYLLLKYRSLGGKKIRLGSDAHFTDHVASGFDRAYELINKVYKGEIK